MEGQLALYDNESKDLWFQTQSVHVAQTNSELELKWAHNFSKGYYDGFRATFCQFIRGGMPLAKGESGERLRVGVGIGYQDVNSNKVEGDTSCDLQPILTVPVTYNFGWMKTQLYPAGATLRTEADRPLMHGLQTGFQFEAKAHMDYMPIQTDLDRVLAPKASLRLDVGAWEFGPGRDTLYEPAKGNKTYTRRDHTVLSAGVNFDWAESSTFKGPKTDPFLHLKVGSGLGIALRGSGKYQFTFGHASLTERDERWY